MTDKQTYCQMCEGDCQLPRYHTRYHIVRTPHPHECKAGKTCEEKMEFSGATFEQKHDHAEKMNWEKGFDRLFDMLSMPIFAPALVFQLKAFIRKERTQAAKEAYERGVNSEDIASLAYENGRAAALKEVEGAVNDISTADIGQGLVKRMCLDIIATLSKEKKI